MRGLRCRAEEVGNIRGRPIKYLLMWHTSFTKAPKAICGSCYTSEWRKLGEPFLILPAFEVAVSFRFRDAEDALNQANSVAAGTATEELVTVTPLLL